MTLQEYAEERWKYDRDDDVTAYILLLMVIDGKIKLSKDQIKYLLEVSKNFKDDLEDKLKPVLESYNTNLIEDLDEPEGQGGFAVDFDPFVKEGLTFEFVIQEHERGLTEKQARSGRRYEGMENIHSDLRIKVKGLDFLIGLTISTPGSAHEKNKLLEIGSKALVAAVKKRQPLEWMEVGKGKNLFGDGTIEMNLYGKKFKADISAPGRVGSTRNTWSRFVAIDYGVGEFLEVKEHYKKFKFEGVNKLLNGIYILTGVPEDQLDTKGFEGRVWLIQKLKNIEKSSIIDKEE